MGCRRRRDGREILATTSASSRSDGETEAPRSNQKPVSAPGTMQVSRLGLTPSLEMTVPRNDCTSRFTVTGETPVLRSSAMWQAGRPRYKCIDPSLRSG